MNVLVTGSLFIALGSTLQALRWLFIAEQRFRANRAEATKRSERVAVEREVRQAGFDIAGWALVAIGAWYVFFGSW